MVEFYDTEEYDEESVGERLKETFLYSPPLLLVVCCGLFVTFSCCVFWCQDGWWLDRFYMRHIHPIAVAIVQSQTRKISGEKNLPRDKNETQVKDSEGIPVATATKLEEAELVL